MQLLHCCKLYYIYRRSGCFILDSLFFYFSLLSWNCSDQFCVFHKWILRLVFQKSDFLLSYNYKILLLTRVKPWLCSILQAFLQEGGDVMNIKRELQIIFLFHFCYICISLDKLIWCEKGQMTLHAVGRINVGLLESRKHASFTLLM